MKIGPLVPIKAQAEFKMQELPIVDSVLDSNSHLIRAAELDRCRRDNRTKW